MEKNRIEEKKKMNWKESITEGRNATKPI